MNLSLENLPEINFAEKNPAVILQELVTKFEEEADRTLFPTDPMRLLMLTLAYVISAVRSNIDFAGKQNLLAFAQDSFIQHIATLVGVKQLGARAAVTILEFRISKELPNATLIRAGTRATVGNNIFFATVADVEIPKGSLSVQAQASCTQLGSVGNGFLIGQVNRLSDPFPFHESVTNITITQGGADVESIEALRSRTQMAPESFSTAGPRGAYIFWAKTANQLIVDVSVETPSPAVVEVIPLLANGEIPNQAVLDEVYGVLNDDRIRPLTDMVIVRKPEIVKYAIDLTYHISRRNAATGLTIQENVSKALQEFILWQKSKLGRDLNKSQLTKMLMKAGINRVHVRKPIFKALQHFEIGIADEYNINVVYGGLVDD